MQPVIWNQKESSMTNFFVEPSPHPKNQSIRIASILIVTFILFVAAATAYAEWREAGVRIGLQAGPKREYFHLYEAFGVYGLPWDWPDGGCLHSSAHPPARWLVVRKPDLSVPSARDWFSTKTVKAERWRRDSI